VKGYFQRVIIRKSKLAREAAWFQELFKTLRHGVDKGIKN